MNAGSFVYAKKQGLFPFETRNLMTRLLKNNKMSIYKTKHVSTFESARSQY